MPKIKVFVTLKNILTKEVLQESYDGILNENKIIYKEGSKTITIYKYSNTITMIRRGEEVMQFHFLKGTSDCIYEFGYKEPFRITIETSLLEMKEKQIHICYQTRLGEEIMGIFDFRLQYEVIL